MTTAPQPRLTRIQRAICRRYGVRHADLVGRRRTEPLASIRQLAIWAMHEAKVARPVDIARAFNRTQPLINWTTRNVKNRFALSSVRIDAEAMLTIANETP